MLIALVGVGGVVLGALVGVLGWEELRGQADAGLFVLLACVLLGELVTVVHSLPVRIETSTGSFFAFATLLEYGVAASCFGMALAVIVVDVARHRPAWVLVANAATWTIALSAAGGLLALLVGEQTGPGRAEPSIEDLPAIAAAGAMMFIVNFVLVTSVVAVDAGTSILAFARDQFWEAAAEDTAGLSVGTIIGLAGVRPSSAPLLLLPFILVAGGRRTVVSGERAMFDPLTGLPNRALLHDRIEQALQRATRDGSGGAVLLVDLDGFKAVNDSLGHQAGDALLAEAAERLAGCVRDSDTVARLGGDEFALLLTGPNNRDGAERVREKVGAALGQPFTVGNSRCVIGASVGIASYPDDATDAAALLEHADQAMYTDKRARKALR